MTENSPPGYRLRTADPDDRAAVSRLFESSYPALMAPSYDPSLLEAALPLLTRANPLLLASGTFFVAEETNSTIVGCGGWTRERPGNGNIEPELAHIRHFAVHPDYAGLGIGRTIYDACVQQAKTAEIIRFECYASLNAVGFYSALGFEKVMNLYVALGDRAKLPGVLMTCSI